jgi:thiol-disulfide isomerase/thioredoxin
MRLHVCCAILLLSSFAAADIVDDVREALVQNNFGAAQTALKSYRDQHGVDGAYLEGLSWTARGALVARDYNQAYSLARQTQLLSAQQLKKRKLDSEPHLPTALGAAYEVESEVLAARGEKPQAILLLKSALQTYGSTSIASRLQKNLNLLTFVGKPAPVLNVTEHLGAPPVSLAQLKGSPMLLFFWAHWCMDCKGEEPILAQLRSEFESKGLKIVAPTQRYGYAARGENASPQAEFSYIDKVWQQYYGGLQGVPVPVSKQNFNTYGASTTPTIVVVDRAGRIAMYHPGAMPYAELRAAVDKVLEK